ncbi:phospho-sugar mutase [Pseudofrankia inefficax]|uniref:Phosphoglucomutase/phosphomannomutase alpha/beta/alpha domain I n=1 Tax=Pseudofrankia inefficax (strain DSM 45817 / CECT 9037 / DDB 130130 / EuI1c) TaxID=298654 RepID=E3J211_PSEI1|nr:phospho-sugar mutase [Pseudofrankia inefficax]ADP84116.1 phosphoglucomutase/phosphomannomutase alpha/beta/alpha domain I [Pseudofrankia inefficax]
MRENDTGQASADERVLAWLAHDPDAADRAEIEDLLAAVADGGRTAAAARTELADRFAGPLTFGTAGLRGPLRAGPNGMNTAVVRRAAAGLATWLAATGAGPKTVVVGFDARHRSEAFARDSARVFAGAGLRALVLPGPVPTPVLAFAVRHLAADAGVMVTASHNPATDNGYKVYLGGPVGAPGRGAQLVAPADEQIEAAIAAAAPASAIPLADTWSQLGDETVAAYVAAAAGTPAGTTPTPGPALRIAYTPLHGVGLDVLRRVFAAAGLPEPVVVAAQAEPDPDFPTAPFPNPEEPGAMDLVLGLAGEIGADLVLAHDPDADRLAVAVGPGPTRAGTAEPGGARVLTGDELGLLLADEVLRTSPGPVATTVVSATALGVLAARRGAPFSETLTGFKWIMRAAEDLAFGYEEALGYAVRPDLVRDKDGVTAAVAVARLAAAEAARGRTLLDRLDDLSRELGVTVTAQVSLRVPDLAASTALTSRLRAAPPTTIGGLRVESIRDLLHPTDTGLPPSDVLIFTLAAGARTVVRPSGTEPKLKIYLEAVEPVGTSLTAARAAAAARVDRLTAWARSL